MDDILRSILEKQCKHYPAVREKLATEVEVKFIQLTQGNLPRVKPGMYWYTDDSVSEVFSSDKELKSVVVLVDKGIIYGDSFQQRYILGKKLSGFMKEMAELYTKNFKWGVIYRPEVEDLKAMYASLSKINAALAKIKKLKWSENLYWAQENTPQSGLVVDMFDGANCKMPYEEGAYIRPLIAFMAS